MAAVHRRIISPSPRITTDRYFYDVAIFYNDNGSGCIQRIKLIAILPAQVLQTFVVPS
jgi:hypothetical protein